MPSVARPHLLSLELFDWLTDDDLDAVMHMLKPNGILGKYDLLRRVSSQPPSP